MLHDTKKEFNYAKNICRKVFVDKMHDYGTSWRVMRPSSLTDQIYIKAKRIKSIEMKGVAAVNEGILPEFIGIVNYCAMALIQLSRMENNISNEDELTNEEALNLYEEAIDSATSLMLNKNHDYDEAWRQMRISSFTDIILQKIMRTRQIEDLKGNTLVSEGLDANYMDMINYALFAIIKLQPDYSSKDGSTK